MKAKEVLGIGLMVGGVILGLYVGIWVCFVGGMVDVIEQVRAENLEAISLAWGIARVFLAGFFGGLSAIIPIAIGKNLLD